MPRRKLNRPRPPLVPPTVDPNTLRGRIGLYLEAMRVGRFTEASVESRGKELVAFANWCEERGILRAEEVTKPIVERYQRWLFHYRKKNGKPLGTSTQYYRLMGVRVLFRWLTKHNYLLSNPASELDLPRVGRRLPRAILTTTEAERVLAQPDIGDVLGLRDRAMLEVLYSTGVRRRELVGLSVFDIDAERGTLLVRQGKGRKDRMVPIGERALAWVEKYLADARPRLVMEPDAGTLFLTAAGEALHPDTLTQMVRERVTAAGIGKKGACHLFRHTMATAMLEGGADIRFIQAMLGHADLQATQIYTQVSITKLKEIHTATHPAAKLQRRAAPAPENPDAADEETLRDELLSSLAAEAAEEVE